MQVFDCTDSGISQCAQIVKDGGVIVFPTDTVYGIGCNPYSDLAVKRIFRIKGREEKKPLPVLVASLADAEKIVTLGVTGRSLAEKFWPGALTIVAPLKDSRISPGVTAGKDSLAVRVPANKCVLGVLKTCRYLVGTSANPSGAPPTRDAQSVIRSLSGFDAILVDSESASGKESTVVDVSGPRPTIARHGAIVADEIGRVLGIEGL